MKDWAAAAPDASRSSTATTVGERLRMKEVTGIPNRGREGLGMRKMQFYSKSSNKDRRDMIVSTVREKEEEQRVIKMTMLSKQGAHMKWEVPQRRVKQADLTGMSEEKLKFLIKSVYDLLPTPANKNKWFESNETCLLCGENGTLNHILAGCKVALSQGRYKWRHDKVLKELAAAVQGMKRARPCARSPTFSGWKPSTSRSGGTASSTATVSI